MNDTESAGVTASERYLNELCKRSFLSLWSYPNLFRDQGRRYGKGDGKELCDHLIIFNEHVIIFSDNLVRSRILAIQTWIGDVGISVQFNSRPNRFLGLSAGYSNIQIASLLINLAVVDFQYRYARISDFTESWSP